MLLTVLLPVLAQLEVDNILKDGSKCTSFRVRRDDSVM